MKLEYEYYNNRDLEGLYVLQEEYMKIDKQRANDVKDIIETLTKEIAEEQSQYVKDCNYLFNKNYQSFEEIPVQELQDCDEIINELRELEAHQWATEGVGCD